MKKIILGVSTLVILGVGVFIGTNNDSSIDTANANPDYICKKSVTNSPCNVVNYPDSCSDWSPDGIRTCPGTITTEVSYYLRRTTCESGYTRVSRGTNSGGSGGRQSADFVSGTTSCTITEEDTVNPIGTIN